MTDLENALSTHLQEFLTLARRCRFAEVLAARIGCLRVVVEDLYDQHNASAIMRNCDAFGVQHMHVVESTNKFDHTAQISLGTERWLTLHRHLGENSRTDCLNELKNADFLIAATVLHRDSQPLDAVPVNRPLAIVFGNERDGVSEEVIEAADYLIEIPMYGFVESFNVSVASALTLHHLTDRIRSQEQDYGLCEDEKAELMLKWTKKTIPNAKAIEDRFWADQNIE